MVCRVWGEDEWVVGGRVCRDIVARKRQWSTWTIVLKSSGYGLYGFS